jgi:hypothetical protein
MEEQKKTMAAETLEQRRDNLLQDGSSLTQDISNEIDASRSLKVSLWEAFRQSSIKDLDERFKLLSYRVKVGCCWFGGHPLTLIQPSFRTPWD